MPSTNPIIRYFDLNSNVVRVRGNEETRGPGAGQPSVKERRLHWVWQYIFLLLGVVIQPAFSHYRESGQWVFKGFYGWTLFAGIAAFIIFPSVYRKVFDPESPLPILLAPIFTAGLGWESLFSAAVKLISDRG